ncbi:MAG: MgtC/SapB family protein, partial [Oscillospiraceae bacterium]|nr:MgtC/SapB family protein [Oscillospiraceae bacterium]
SALVMITSQYMSERFGTGDPARLGAQVISGIGFLGAGTIMITSRQVKGLTTAAGLWAAACIGLAVGIGFYTGAILCAVFVLIVMTVMSGWDTKLRMKSKQMNFFGEFMSMEDLGKFMDMLRSSGYKLHDLELDRAGRSVSDLVGATFWIELDRPTNHIEVIRKLSSFEGVRYIDELEFM